MTSTDSSARNPRLLRSVASIAVLALVGMIVLLALVMTRSRPQSPKLLNQPTEARRVKPFTKEPDKRFAPLPIEREEHER
jgi:hypothetical protein